MNDRLKLRIEQLRRALAARDDGITLGEFHSGVKKLPQIELSPQHLAFLDLSDGGRFGSVDVWSSDELSQNQYRATVMPGGAAAWLEVGQVVYEPVFLHRSDGTIHLPEFTGETARMLDGFDTYLEDYVFGGKYSELFTGADKDKWHAFLVSMSG